MSSFSLLLLLASNLRLRRQYLPSVVFRQPFGASSVRPPLPSVSVVEAAPTWTTLVSGGRVAVRLCVPHHGQRGLASLCCAFHPRRRFAAGPWRLGVPPASPSGPLSSCVYSCSVLFVLWPIPHLSENTRNLPFSDLFH